MTEFETALQAWTRGDKTGAIQLWRMLATQGDVRSQYNLAVLFDTGDSVIVDKDLAESYYRDAALQGFDDAALNLAILLEERRDKANLPEIVTLYSGLAVKGRAEAQFRIGLYYDTGDAIEQDHEQAARWYYAAAEQGHVEAASNLARCFAMGEGLERSDLMAFKWYSIAAELGGASAARYRERVARELKADQRLRAGELAQQWLSEFRRRHRAQ